jgi:hypothetical protein
VTSAAQPVIGAKVNLIAWPRNSVTAASPQGATVPTHVVGSAVSSNSGRYAITVTNWSAVRAAANYGGVVNLEVMARHDGYVAVHSFSRVLTASGGLAADNDAQKASTAPQQANLSLVGGPSGRPGGTPCGTTQKIKYLGKRWTVVGLTSSHVPGVVMNFTYTADSNSSLGVGFSSTGNNGSRSESGTATVSTSGSESWPAEVGAKSTLYKTLFKYWKFLVVCYGLQVNPTEWAAGTARGHEGEPPASYCVPQIPGTTFTKTKTAAWEFSAGVSTSPVIGINLSAQTGYDHQASLSYHFPQRRWLCGRNDDPGGHPGYVVAGLS